LGGTASFDAIGIADDVEASLGAGKRNVGPIDCSHKANIVIPVK
jgi:hypothetical protein